MSVSTGRPSSSSVPSRPDRASASLADQLRTALQEAAANLGDPRIARLRRRRVEAVTGEHRQATRDELARLRTELATVARRRSPPGEPNARRSRPAGSGAAAAFAARTGSRANRAGAPLWAVVDFAPGLPDADASAVQAGAAGGEHAGRLGAADGPRERRRHPRRRSGQLGRTAAATAARASTAGTDTGPGPRAGTRCRSAGVGRRGAAGLGRAVELRIRRRGCHGRGNTRTCCGADDLTTGRFRQGIQLGAHHKPQAEYIGNTARARRRLARSGRAGLADRVRRTDGGRTPIRHRHSRAAWWPDRRRPKTALPSAAPVLEALRRIDRAAAAVRAINGELDNARSDFDRAVAAVGGTERLLATAAAARSMPRSTAGVDQMPLPSYVSVEAGALDAARRTAAMRDEQLTGAGDEVQTARDQQQAAPEQAEMSGMDHRARTEELATLRGAVGVEVRNSKGTSRRPEANCWPRTWPCGMPSRPSRPPSRTRENRRARKRRHQRTDQRGHRGTARFTRWAPFARSDIRGMRAAAGTPAWPTAAEQWTNADGLTTTAIQALIG